MLRFSLITLALYCAIVFSVEMLGKYKNYVRNRIEKLLTDIAKLYGFDWSEKE